MICLPIESVALKRRRSLLSIAFIVCAITVSLTLGSTNGLAQNAGIGTTAPNSSALLDLTSTSLGLLVPRLTQTEMSGISGPATGLLIFDTTASAFYYYDGTVWRPILSSLTAWTLTGNSGTLPSTNFLGTTDSVDFRLDTYDTSRIAVTAPGYIGMGTTAPTRPLEVVRDASVNVHTAAFRSSVAGVALGGLGSTTLFGSVQAYEPSATNFSTNLGVQTLYGGKVGVKTQTPKTLFDVNGDASVEDSGIAITKGVINNFAIGGYTFIRITSATGAFTFTGFSGGAAGKILIIYNTTTDNMTIDNDNAGSTVGNRVYTLSGNIATTGTGSVAMIYSSSDAHWHVLSLNK